MPRIIALLFLLLPAISQAQLRLSVFDCGRLMFEDVSAFGLSNEETSVRELFVPCYLVQHDDHLMVWDGGLPLAAVGDESGNSRYETSFIEQLAAMNITPADVDYIAFSHLHYDHVGAANAFTEATLLIQATEAEAGLDNEPDFPAAQPQLYAEIRDNPRVTLDGDHDVFGDGSVRILSAPGHTPGHQALFLQLENFGPLVLSGDLYHFAFSRENRRVPIFNTDAQQTRESMARIEAFVEETGATFWIEHELELAESLNLAPAYYD